MANELTEPRSQDDPPQTFPSLPSVCFTCLPCKTTMFHWFCCFLVIIYSCRKDGASKEWAKSQKFIAEAECGNVWVILQSHFQFEQCSARSCVKIVQCWTYTQTVSKKPQVQPYLACPSLHPECYWLLMCSMLEDLPRQSIKCQNETTYKMLTRGTSRTKLTVCFRTVGKKAANVRPQESPSVPLYHMQDWKITHLLPHITSAVTSFLCLAGKPCLYSQK